MIISIQIRAYDGPRSFEFSATRVFRGPDHSVRQQTAEYLQSVESEATEALGCPPIKAQRVEVYQIQMA